MFLNDEPSLREIVVLVLARQGASTAQGVQASIVKRHRKCSLQAVYVELSHLIDAGVILKANGRFDLTMAWVCKLHEFSEKLNDKYFSRPSSLFALPDVGEKIRITFSDSRRADIFWMQCIVKLLASSKSRKFYQWVPRPWHRLVHDHVSDEFGDVMRRLGARDYIIAGGTTFLDRQGYDTWTSDVITFSTAPSPFHKERTEYLTVMDDFVVTNSYPAKFMQEVDRYFRQVKHVHDIKGRDLYRIFSQKTAVRICIDHNPAKAEKLRRKFVRYFGARA